MQTHPEITRTRIANFIPALMRWLYPEAIPVQLSVYPAPDRIPFDQALRGEYRPARVGEMFGPRWATHWFHVEGEIPAAWRGHEVHFLWDSSSEAMVWQDGAPAQGLTGTVGAENALRCDFIVTKNARGGERVDLYVEMACNGLFGFGQESADPNIGLLRQAELARFDRAAWDLLWDYVVVAECALHLPLDTPRGGQALYAANAMVNVLRRDHRATWQAAREIAAQFLNARNGDGQHNLSAIGNAHIDSAWLWQIAETKRKIARSLSSTLRYMDDYPEYKFVLSQAQQYQWVKENYPALYERLKQRVREGRIVPAGGTWVEPDCNLPSGESLVRQFLYGQRFFRAEFGSYCREFWNPDVFGYSGALPQIIRGAGMRFFLTQKLSWNQFNKPAHHTFWWQGIDGSRVLTHFPPADTYNARVKIQELLYNARNFRDHARSNESYFLFGHGDGGGGPTPEMLERLKRVRDVDGLPRVEQRSPQEFFARCEAGARDLFVWVGELYFETHRGTYTTQARTKWYNRRSEFLLHDVEFLAAVAHARGQRAYPASELEMLWRDVLTHQFHDILPGSSIGEVYADAAAVYERVLARGAALRAEMLDALLPHDDAKAPRVGVVNTLGFARAEVVELPDTFGAAQHSADGKPLGVVRAPAYGFAVLEPLTWETAARIAEQDNTFVLENDFLRATLRHDGALVSLYDKRASRECIAAGAAANHFILYDDNPNEYDAWDADVFHLEKRDEAHGALSARIVERGPLRVAARFEYALSDTSALTQTVSLDALAPRLDFDTRIEWHEAHRFLKVEFPLNLLADEATYEIQFGHVKRPTHMNTSWDLARFEVCAHKWADLAEPDFGVALLNDCKYGYAAHGNVLRLSLLRAPKYPDPNADMGTHKVRYALMPHAGSFQDAGVIPAAYAFNVPLLLSVSRAAPTTQSFFELDADALVLDTIKRAEDSDALIVRLYEAHGTRGVARLTSPLPFQSAALCNLLEEPEATLEWQDGGVAFAFRPFQILTLQLTR
jgi:alpha-mannosidase